MNFGPWCTTVLWWCLFLTRLDSLIRITVHNPPEILRSSPSRTRTHTQEYEQDEVASSIYSFSGLIGDDTPVSAVASQGGCSKGEKKVRSVTLPCTSQPSMFPLMEDTCSCGQCAASLNSMEGVCGLTFTWSHICASGAVLMSSICEWQVEAPSTKDSLLTGGREDLSLFITAGQTRPQRSPSSSIINHPDETST